jgi:quinol monooxygenase YgiN
MFDDFDAYHDGEHEGRTAKEFDMKTVMLTGGMMDFAGGFRGACKHQEKNNVSATGVYTVFTTAKARNEGSAKAIIEQCKAHGTSMLEAEEGALRCTVFMTGGDIPPQFQDQVTVRWIEQWSSAAAYEAHKKAAYAIEASAKYAELSESFDVVEYSRTNHIAKDFSETAGNAQV